jgi:protein gp37
VSEGCAHCYAEAVVDNRLNRAQWAPGKPRVRTSAGYWKQPELWNREAAIAGWRPKVFCASLADVFDEEAPIDWLQRLLCLIAVTPALTWLLLTKRPERIVERITLALPGQAAAWAKRWPINIWLGTSIESQATAEARIPEQLKIPAARRFLSAEPLLARVDLSARLKPETGLDWVIAGGESGPHARTASKEWFRTILYQCQAAGVPFFFKQAGGLLDGREWNERPADA